MSGPVSPLIKLSGMSDDKTSRQSDLNAKKNEQQDD